MEKKKIKQKKISKNSKQKEKILKEIASKLKENFSKKENQIQKEENEEISEFENANFENFRTNLSFGDFSERSSPVLERIAGSQGNPIFVRSMSSNSFEEPDEIKKRKSNSEYIASADNSNEPKYSASYTESVVSPEKMDFSKAGRKTSEFIQESPGAFLRQPSEASGWESSKEEIWSPERVNLETVGRKSPLEIQEEKYKAYKFKTGT